MFSPDARQRWSDRAEYGLLVIHFVLVLMGMYGLATGWPYLDPNPHAWVLVPLNLLFVIGGASMVDLDLTRIKRAEGIERAHRFLLPSVLDRVVRHEVFEVSPGRRAVRHDTHHAVLLCAQCGGAVMISHHDEGEIMTNADILDALTTWPHECQEKSE